jgi:hypothetical protein
MSHRQLADAQGDRWDVIDEGPVRDEEDTGSEVPHRLRFVSDDGEERTAMAPRGVDALRDAELRALMEGKPAESAGPGPDLAANRVEGYGDER